MTVEADIKQLRMTVDALSRKCETLEKQIRALPDLTALAKLGPRLDAAEKAIAGKKDMKPEHELLIKANAKWVAEQQARVKEVVTTAQMEARNNIVEARFKQVEALAQAALAMGKR
jgi:hypothetical protein